MCKDQNYRRVKMMRLTKMWCDWQKVSTFHRQVFWLPLWDFVLSKINVFVLFVYFLGMYISILWLVQIRFIHFDDCTFWLKKIISASSLVSKNVCLQQWLRAVYKIQITLIFLNIFWLLGWKFRQTKKTVHTPVYFMIVWCEIQCR